MQEAIFAAGCFWGIEAAFRKIDGVLDAEVGYIGGESKNPNYKEVCSGNTGHAEACRVVFNSEKTSFDNLLDAFWSMHNPTQKNRQGFDMGSQYRSAIFYADQQQKATAEQSRDRATAKFSKPIVTEIVEKAAFWPAEDYHQRYIEKKRRIS